ncbi:MAG: NAD(P)/FAD-dependent oxidoreductase [Chloroflexi bacterium]|nr:NAD(P)/FAD-dependent oxidoreductase [Chloroflexota bacterium]
MTDAPENLDAIPDATPDSRFPVVVIGAGPAGLTAAHQLAEKKVRSVVFEKSDRVGGLARTECYKGYRFDIGGHRFYTKVTEVQKLWEKMLGPDLVKVSRLSRIYYRGKFFHYPIEFFDTLTKLGLVESTLALLSYLRSRLFPSRPEETLEEWVSNRFGWRLYRAFFKSYTEKVWGIPCNQIHAEWAAQRIRGLSFESAVAHALFRHSQARSLIHEFQYPRHGPGMMWERFQQQIQAMGSVVKLGACVTRVERNGQRITGVVVESDGAMRRYFADHFISSMPLAELVFRIDPPVPDEVIEAARGLHYRAFIIVELVIKREHLFPDNWIYVHTPEVRVGRIQNFKNWSPEMVPDPSTTSLGMEFFCDEGDELWTMSDVALIAHAVRELEVLRLADPDEVVDGVVVRQPKAYPVYDPGYRERLQVIQRYLASIENLQTMGRNGTHRYNNQDHSMVTGILAAWNVLGQKNDLWGVNTDRSYYEEFVVESDDMSE